MHDSLAPDSKRTAHEMFCLIEEHQAGELPVKAFCELKKHIRGALLLLAKEIYE
jgi:hypothetical protein